MRLIATGLAFPEGPIAEADGSVLLVEIQAQRLTRVHADGRLQRVAQLAGGPNGAAVGPGGQIYVCNNGGFGWVRENGGLRPHGPSADYAGGWIEVVDPATGKSDRLYDACDGLPLKGPNDLVFDGQGGFWFTDLGKRRAHEMDLGSLYWAKADGSCIRRVATPLLTPNGVGLSPDGKYVYVAETDTGRVWSFEVAGPGELRRNAYPSPHGGRLVAAPGGYLRLDSLAVTASGRVCVAALEHCAIMEVDPRHGGIYWHTVPDSKVTNLCFGGPALRTAFVTLSHRGELVALDWHEPGLALHHQPLP
ncbi:SMP-30/gluconolactonase/LRE family protein [Bordetella genomosp. 12]|uniref:Gluconolaconase n=1 Tax=Bordetella genomosp. 12 TaxID=463035 RepID=A0A261VBJ0_9BORD|nr:SMP-30/gluconolactonase/LRE family protein [Bordetella genomosp. 12]OZI70950.1 gluconolaconase [Bordetella genomosp. 12]